MPRSIRIVLAALAVSLSLPLAARADSGLAPAYSADADLFGFTTGQKGLNFAVPSGGGPTIGFSYLLAPRAALEVNLGLGFTFTSPSDFAFSVELGYRSYFARFGNRLFPFFQPGFYFARANSSESIAIEGLFGVEYFLLEHFSVAGATGLAFNIGNIGNGSVTARLATGTTSLFANFYF